MAQEHGSGVRRGLFFKRMILIYTISTSIIFIGFSLIMSASIQKNYTGYISEMNNKALFQSANACSITLDNLYEYFYMDILESPELVELLLADEYSASRSIVFNKLSKRLMNYSNLVESCYVINLKGDFICTTMDTYKGLDSFPDQEIFEWLEHFRDNPMTYTIVPRSTEFQILNSRYNKKYITFIYKKYSEGYLVINIDYDKFVNMVNYRSYSNSSRTLLIGAGGYVLADSSEELFGEKMDNDPFYKALWDQKKNEGSYLVQADSAKKIVNYRRNESFGIQYLTITDYYILDIDNTLLLQLIIYSFIAVFINLGLILAATRFLYKPIEKLRDFIGHMWESGQGSTDEFEQFESALRIMKKDSKEYKKTKQKRLMKELLEDQAINVETHTEELMSLKGNFDKTGFLVINFHFEKDIREKEDMSLYKFAVENIFREQLTQDIYLEMVDYGHHLTGVLNLHLQECIVQEIPRTDNGMPEMAGAFEIKEVEDALFGMQEKMGDFFQVSVSCSVGNIVTSLFDISESYRNAVNAEFYQVQCGSSSVIYFENLEQEGASRYPGIIAKEILNAIKNTDKKGTVQAIQSFFGELAHNTYDNAIKHICLLDMEIIKLKLKLDIDLQDSEYEMLTGIRSGSRMFELQEICMKHCLDIITAYREEKENNSNKYEIVRNVCEIVKVNICNSDLSVNMIAQEVFLSTSYLRNIFKEVMGNTLSNHIIGKRLEEICRLLQATELSIPQIAEQMGFSSKHYLHKFFKNYKGITPNQYREQVKNKDVC